MNHNALSTSTAQKLSEQMLTHPVSVADIDQHHPGVLDAYLYRQENSTLTLADGFELEFEGSKTICLPIKDEKPAHGDSPALVEDGYILLDEDAAGEFAGFGHLVVRSRAGQPDSTRSKPFVGFTETEQDHQRQGFGKRRLKLMNELAKQAFDELLESDVNSWTEPEAAAVWWALVSEGLAEEVSVKPTRWRFKD